MRKVFARPAHALFLGVLLIPLGSLVWQIEVAWIWAILMWYAAHLLFFAGAVGVWGREDWTAS